MMEIRTCELHRAEMEIRHYKQGDIASCPHGCVEQGPPGSFQESVTPLEKECAWEACNAPFVPDRYNPTQPVPHPRMPPGLLSPPSKIGRYQGGRMKVPVMKAALSPSIECTAFDANIIGYVENPHPMALEPGPRPSPRDGEAEAGEEAGR